VETRLALLTTTESAWGTDWQTRSGLSLPIRLLQALVGWLLRWEITRDSANDR
jgi:hypothetical protein